MQSLLESAPQKKFISKLLSWYRKTGRHDIPWRKTKDSYSVFISEFMLQQTTVATVKPYYDRFLKRFPTVKSLARSNLNDVLALWSGLGYYARARNLRSAMQTIEKDYRGKIPSDPALLQKLPGVGPYTAGAIAAFAFNKPAAVLDGNIIRVFMRILVIEDDPKLKAVQIVLKKTALDLVSATSRARSSRWKKGGSRDINLALMDLGSTVCLPQNPRCERCPVAEFCLAKHHGKQNEIPLRGETPERPITRRLFAVVSNEGRYLIGQRPKEGLFGGLWEFPGVDGPSGVEIVPFLEGKIEREAGYKIQVREAIPAFEHQLSHRIFIVRPFLCDYVGMSKAGPISRTSFYERYQWVSLSQLTKMGISAITKRILAQLNLNSIS